MADEFAVAPANDPGGSSADAVARRVVLAAFGEARPAGPGGLSSEAAERRLLDALGLGERADRLLVPAPVLAAVCRAEFLSFVESSRLEGGAAAACVDELLELMEAFGLWPVEDVS